MSDYDFGKGLEGWGRWLLAFLFFVVVLATWKLVDIVIWIFKHADISWK